MFNLYNPRWPLHTWMRPLPPAKFVFDEDGPGGVRRVGYATNSLVSEGSIVSGGHVSGVGAGAPRARVNSLTSTGPSCEGVDIGRHCRIRRTIIDKNVRIPPIPRIGFDLEADTRRFQVIDGIVVIPRTTTSASRRFSSRLRQRAY